MRYRYIFGPVPSRRLGVSLGIDMVPHKTCSMDCLYCECGKTTLLTLEPAAYVASDRVIAELDHYFSNHPDPDYITFSGSGEPCLNTGLGDVIAHIRKIRPAIRIAVLTNATLMGDPAVQKVLLNADLVVPSLDSARDSSFKRINRPAEGVSVEAMIGHIAGFCSQFTGPVWLEILILPEINDSKEDVMALKNAVHQIRPDLVQINTLDRPGTEPSVYPATTQELEAIAAALSYEPVQVVGGVQPHVRTQIRRTHLSEAVMETLSRRPCTMEDLSRMLNVEDAQLADSLKGLVDKGLLRETRSGRGIFYETIAKENG